VGLVKRAYRPGQEVVVTSLDGLAPESVDMQSILVVGNSATRLVAASKGARMLTPRGYAGKYGLAGEETLVGS
jgi:precorrin-3B C17-methyltransferase